MLISSFNIDSGDLLFPLVLAVVEQYAHESHGLPSPTPKHIKPHHRGDTIILRAQGCRSMYP